MDSEMIPKYSNPHQIDWLENCYCFDPKLLFVLRGNNGFRNRKDKEKSTKKFLNFPSRKIETSNSDDYCAIGCRGRESTLISIANILDIIEIACCMIKLSSTISLDFNNNNLKLMAMSILRCLFLSRWCWW